MVKNTALLTSAFKVLTQGRSGKTQTLSSEGWVRGYTKPTCKGKQVV